MTFPRLAKLTEKLDDVLRFRDLHAHRTVGGRLDVPDARYGIRRHTRPALVLPALLCGFLILAAPSLLRSAIAVIVAAAVFLILRRVMAYSDRKNWPLRRDLLIQIVAVLLTAGAVWIFGQDSYRPDGVYRHFFLGIAVALCFALLAASALVFTLFHRLCESSDYDQYLNETELFADRGPAPVVTEGTIVTALLMALFRAPLQLLTVPAMVALVMPPVWVRPATLGTGVVIFLALAFAGLNERFSVMWDLTQAVFFKGGSLIVSLVVIALGIGRLAGVSYVTTVFDAAAGSVIVVVLASAYVLSWWYDYWASRLLTDQILGLFQKGVTGTASIPYDIDPAYVATAVPDQDRVLQIHGASRLIVICPNPPTTFFQSYTMTDLIDTVAMSGAPGGRAIPTPIQVRGRIFNFHTLAGLVFVVLIAIPGIVIQRGVQMPELESKQSSTAGVPLSSLLFDDSRNREGRPVIVVAASGGGTRAALYTASVLEGIAKLGKSGDVMIGSGVSGGGAALAYFAANRPRLVQGGVDDWQLYFDRMKQPFIQDVLRRALEWRMIAGGRLGQLLDESFKSRWELNDSRALLSDIHDFGLILNTSLAGHLDLPPGVGSTQPLREFEPKYRQDRTSADLAGGRLILTNLNLPKELAGKPLEPDVSHELPVILRGDDVRLETAAALNANFPPVFPNAAIDVDNQTRYWVTDGGAVDN